MHAASESEGALITLALFANDDSFDMGDAAPESPDPHCDTGPKHKAIHTVGAQRKRIHS